MVIGRDSVSASTRDRSAGRLLIRNAVYPVADYAMLFGLWLVATPLLVFHLGVEGYGLLMLANSIMGFGALVSFGMPDATIRFVAVCRSRADHAGACAVMRTSLTLHAVVSALGAAVLWQAAPFLARRVFSLPDGFLAEGVGALQAAAVGFAARILLEELQAGFQGCERFDIPARVNVIVNSFVMLAYLALATHGRPVNVLLWWGVAFNAGGVIVAAALLRARVLPGLRLLPLCDRAWLRRLVPFGFFGWIRQLSVALTQQVDVMLVASLAGLAAVTPYTIARRLAMQPQAVATRASSFLFPYASRLDQQGRAADYSAAFRKATLWITLLNAVPLFILMAAGEMLLRLWMRETFDPSAVVMLRWICAGFLLQGPTITVYLFLMGRGRIRLTAWIALTRAVLVLGSMAVLLPWMGAVGAAAAQALRLPHSAASWLFCRRLIHGSRSGPAEEEHRT